MRKRSNVHQVSCIVKYIPDRNNSTLMHSRLVKMAMWNTITIFMSSTTPHYTYQKWHLTTSLSWLIQHLLLIPKCVKGKSFEAKSMGNKSLKAYEQMKIRNSLMATEHKSLYSDNLKTCNSTKWSLNLTLYVHVWVSERDRKTERFKMSFALSLTVQGFTIM